MLISMKLYYVATIAMYTFLLQSSQQIVLNNCIDNHKLKFKLNKDAGMLLKSFWLHSKKGVDWFRENRIGYIFIKTKGGNSSKSTLKLMTLQTV